MNEQERKERLAELQRDRAAKLACLERALRRAIDRGEPFASPNGSLFLEVVAIEARMQELA